MAEFLREADSIYASAGYTCYEVFGDAAVVIVPVLDSFNKLSRGLAALVSTDLSQY